MKFMRKPGDFIVHGTGRREKARICTDVFKVLVELSTPCSIFGDDLQWLHADHDGLWMQMQDKIPVAFAICSRRMTPERSAIRL